MERLKLCTPWFHLLLPVGLPVTSPTIITGAGGSAKPMIGNFIMDEWLQKCGSLQYKIRVLKIQVLNTHRFRFGCLSGMDPCQWPGYLPSIRTSPRSYLSQIT